MVVLDDANVNWSETEEETFPNGPQEEQGNNNNDHPENIVEILQIIMEALKQIWLQIKAAINILMVDLGGYQILDRAVQWSVQHPQMSLCLLAFGMISLLPILLVIGVAFSSIAMTLTGILVMEGTLLTILSMLLFGLLGALIIVMLFFSILAVAAYFGFAQIYDLSGNVNTYKLALTRFLQKESQTSNQEFRNRNSPRTQ
ncbi:lipid droplet assembly factor 1 [Haematobia irritans]|uniref:lipid droplet assembly factor 1 n=1 Tax=Haematobia irritans TaxID=7368 RepID=UPI003F505C55